MYNRVQQMEQECIYKNRTDEELIRLYHEGLNDVMDFILTKYKGMVRSKARALFLLGGDTDDLIQEGMIGLMKAVRDFKEDGGALFSSFASLCITRQLYTAVDKSLRQKHKPLNTYISLHEVPETMEEEASFALIDTIEAPKETNPEDVFLGNEFTSELLEEMQKRLSDFELQVLSLYIMGTDVMTIASVINKSEKSVSNAIFRIKSKTEHLLTLESKL